MSEKSDKNWEKFLTGDNESATNSPETSPAESKQTQRPETLEEKIARVMAGINMPKKTGAGTSTGAVKSKAGIPLADKSDEKVPSPTPTPNPTNGLVEEDKQLPVKSSSPHEILPPVAVKRDPTPEPPIQEKKKQEDEDNGLLPTPQNNTSEDTLPNETFSEPIPEEESPRVTISIVSDDEQTLDLLSHSKLSPQDKHDAVEQEEKSVADEYGKHSYLLSVACLYKWHFLLNRSFNLFFFYNIFSVWYRTF